MTDRELMTAILDLAGVDWHHPRASHEHAVAGPRHSFRFEFDTAGRLFEAWYFDPTLPVERSLVAADPRYYKGGRGG